MKEILQTESLLFEKSEFLIDLVKHSSGGIYVEIIQTILDTESGQSSIKINSKVLTDIIKVLQTYHAEIPFVAHSISKHLTNFDKERIKDLYIKGITIKDIAMQINQTEKLIEITLINYGLSIVEQKLPLDRYDPKKKRWYRK